MPRERRLGRIFIAMTGPVAPIRFGEFTFDRAAETSSVRTKPSASRHSRRDAQLLLSRAGGLVSRAEFHEALARRPSEFDQGLNFIRQLRQALSDDAGVRYIGRSRAAAIA